MQLADSQQRERIVLGVVGDFQRVSGLAKILVNMRDRVSVQKPLLLLDQFVAIWHNVPPMFDALAGNNEFAEAFFTMTEWLEQLIQNKVQISLEHRGTQEFSRRVCTVPIRGCTMPTRGT